MSQAGVEPATYRLGGGIQPTSRYFFVYPNGQPRVPILTLIMTLPLKHEMKVFLIDSLVGEGG